MPNAQKYLSQNFAAAVALPGGGVRNDPCHLRGRGAFVRSLPAGFAGTPLRGLAHAAGARTPDTPQYFHSRTESRVVTGSSVVCVQRTEHRTVFPEDDAVRAFI